MASPKCAESVKEDSWAFLLTTFGVLTVVVLGGEASCSLLTGVSQSGVFGVLVNDFFGSAQNFWIYNICYCIPVKFAISFSFLYQSQKTAG